jgi:hypothetical protein
MKQPTSSLKGTSLLLQKCVDYLESAILVAEYPV